MYAHGYRNSLAENAPIAMQGPNYSYAPPQRRNPYAYDVPASEAAPIAMPHHGATPPLPLRKVPSAYFPPAVAAALQTDFVAPASPSRHATSSPVTDRSFSASANSSNEYMSSPVVPVECKALTSSFVAQQVPPETYAEFLAWAKHQHPQSVERAIAAEGFTDIETLRDPHRSTLMHAACEAGNLSLVQYLCESFSEMHGVEHYDDCGRLPVHIAAEKGLVSLVRYFFAQRHLDANATTLDGYNVLHVAAKFNHQPLLHYLLGETRLNVNSLSGAYETPLLLASAAGHMESVKMLLADARCNVRCVDSCGRDVLQVAVHRGHRSLVEFLLSSDCLEVDAVVSCAEGCFRDAIEQRDYNLLSLLSTSLPISEAMMPLLTAAANTDPVVGVILFGSTRSRTASQETYTPRSDLTVSPRIQETIPVVGMAYTAVDVYDSPACTPRTQSRDFGSPVSATGKPLHLSGSDGVPSGKSLISPASWSGAVPPVPLPVNRDPPSVLGAGKSGHNASWHGGVSPASTAVQTPREEVLKALSTEEGDEAVSVNSNSTAGSSLVASRLQMFGGGAKSKNTASSRGDASGSKLVRCSSSSASVKSTSSTCSTSSGLGGVPSTSQMFNLVAKGDVAELERFIGVTPNIRHDIRNVVDENGSYLIHHAVLFGHLNVVQYLVEGLGCDIHMVNQYGRTALHIAVLQEQVLIVRYFTKYCGARLDAVCKEGQSALDCAEVLKSSEKRDEIRRTLQRAASKSAEKRMKITLPVY